MGVQGALTAESGSVPRHVAAAIIRGQVIETDLVEFGGRGDGDLKFWAPSPAAIVDRLPLGHSSKLTDLYALTIDEIFDYLASLSRLLDLDTNPHLRIALEGSYLTAPTTAPILDYAYRTLHRAFDRKSVEEVAERTVGIRFLEGWVPTTLCDGRIAHIRAFGSKQLHVVAGNAPLISAVTIIRNAISRSDTIIKLPSNDPFTALAIVRTMCDMAPDHPLTRHISVAYWKGGDEAIERVICHPENVEKIVAWGGLASVKHMTRYIQPGLELISLDPKSSISVIGADAFADEDSLRDAARKQAVDFAAFNQQGCLNARIAYAQSGTDAAGLERLNRFGELVYEALLDLPANMSTKPKRFDRELKSNIEALRLQDDWYRVIGGEQDEGAVIVSLLPEAVGFAASLTDRVLNIVPIDVLEEALNACDAYTQTIGIYPESLKASLRDRLPLFGAQRIVSLGFAPTPNISLPQDAIEPLRRACKWIVDEQSVPETISPYWR